MHDRSPAIIFVHGLNSQCRTAFPNMMDSFRNDDDLKDCELVAYDYDTTASVVSNGEALFDRLQAFRGRDVVIIAHSMGGLVARYACLSRGSGSTARCLIMLSTPNFGALRASQLSLLAQVIFQSSAATLGLYWRKPGLMDLTRIYQVFQDAYGAGLNKTSVEYATVPAMYFHASRADVFWPLRDLLSWRTTFGVVNLVSRYTGALDPLLRITLAKPHDGIVEESSTAFIPLVSGRWSEKADSINSNTPAERKTYVHIRHRAADELHHNDIAHDPRIIGLVKSLFLTESISTWVATYGADHSYELEAVV